MFELTNFVWCVIMGRLENGGKGRVARPPSFRDWLVTQGEQVLEMLGTQENLGFHHKRGDTREARLYERTRDILCSIEAEIERLSDAQ